MKIIKQFLKRLPIYLLIVAAVSYGVWQFFEKNKVPEVLLPQETTAATEYSGPVPQYAGHLRVGDTFESKQYYHTGMLECTVTDIRIVEEESQCPPNDWFYAPLAVMVGDRAQVCDRKDWFTEGGAFDQGCRIVVVDMTVKNRDAVGLPEGEGGYTNDPTAFNMSWLMKLVDRSIVRTENIDELCYQPYLDMGFSLLNSYIPEKVDGDSCYVQLPPGEKISFSLCYPVYQNDDGSPKDLSDLALSTESLWVADRYLFEVMEE